MLNCGDRPRLDNSQSNATRETKTDVNRLSSGRSREWLRIRSPKEEQENARDHGGHVSIHQGCEGFGKPGCEGSGLEDDVRTAVEDQQGHEGKKCAKCPEAAGTAMHRDELHRKSTDQNSYGS